MIKMFPSFSDHCCSTAPAPPIHPARQPARRQKRSSIEHVRGTHTPRRPWRPGRAHPGRTNPKPKRTTGYLCINCLLLRLREQNLRLLRQTGDTCAKPAVPRHAQRQAREALLRFPMERLRADVVKVWPFVSRPRAFLAHLHRDGRRVLLDLRCIAQRRLLSLSICRACRAHPLSSAAPGIQCPQ